MKMSELRKQQKAAESKLRKENIAIQKQLDQALESLADARGARQPPRSPKRTASVRTDHARVFMGDMHGYYQEAPVVKAILADMEKIQPAEICLLGDMLDCGGFLAQHHTLGFWAEGEYTFEDDVAATNDFLTRLQTVCPEARIVYLEGNHEHHIEQWCITQALRSAKDGAMLLRHFGPRAVLSLKERGITYVSQSEFACDVPIRGTWKYGTKCEVYATHGITACKHAAARHVERFGGNIVYGHTHRADSCVINTVAATLIGGWSPGCMCQRVRLWNHNQPDNWASGYHLQLVSKSGLFQPLNVKLIKGQSLLHSLLS